MTDKSMYIKQLYELCLVQCVFKFISVLFHLKPKTIKTINPSNSFALKPINV